MVDLISPEMSPIYAIMSVYNYSGAKDNVKKLINDWKDLNPYNISVRTIDTALSVGSWAAAFGLTYASAGLAGKLL